MALTVETIPGTTHILTAADDGKLLRFTSSSTITVTANETNTTGFEALLYQAGSGQIQVVAGGSAVFLEERAPFTRGTNAILHTTCPEDGKYKFSGEFASASFLSLINIAGGAPPTVNDDATSGYSVGSAWFFGNDIYDCTDASVGAAVWQLRFVATTSGDGSLYLDDTGNYSRPPSQVKFWKASDNTAMSDPGAGRNRWNNVTQSASTALALSTTDDDGNDLTTFLSQLKVGDALYLQQSSNANNAQYWAITGITDNTTWLQLAVTLLDFTGSNIGNNQNTLLQVRQDGGTAAAASKPPSVSSSSHGLSIIDDRVVMADPTSGDLTLTLPDAAPNTGAEFVVKRVTNGGNSVILATTGSDTIDDNDQIILAHEGEHLTVISDGTTTWRIINKQIATFASLATVAPTTQALTTSFTKLDIWDTNVISTIGKLEADQANGQFDILAATSGVNTYRIEASVTLETAVNNKFVKIQPYANGALTGAPISVNGLGSGKPVTVVINEIITAIGNTNIELHVCIETAETTTFTSAVCSVSKLSGE